MRLSVLTLSTDTAQSYGNERQLGEAFKSEKFDRSKFWITTKHSRDEGIGSFESSLNDSLENVREFPSFS